MNGDTIIMHQDAIEVYVTETGGVAIKSHGDGGYREDQIVVIRPQNIDVLVDALKIYKKGAVEAEKEVIQEAQNAIQ